MKELIETEGNLKTPSVPSVPTSSPQFLSPELDTPLRAYIPGAILARLAAGQSGWLAELRRVTVLFINLLDLTYSTPLPQAQTVMQALQTALYRYEGSLNRIGVDDKGPVLLAALGLPPLAHEDDAARGVKAALDMHAVLQKLGWRCAIGVTTGRAFCGSVGNATRREYTMMGDVVNLAARLMQAAGATADRRPETADSLVEKVSQAAAIPILCDEATFQAAQSQIAFEVLPPIKVKGKVQPIPIYRPITESSPPKSKIQNLKSKIEMVGRAAERMLLAEALQRLQRGHSGVVIIEGEAGIGKSRLVADLLTQAQALSLRSLIGMGDAIEKSATYHAWQPVFRHLFGLMDGTETLTAYRHVQDYLARLNPALAEQTPLLSAVLPFDFPDNEVTTPIQGKARAEKTRALLVGTLARAMQGENGQAMPLLVVIEDAHWLDSASWALLQQVQQEVKPLLLVMAARPMLDARSGEAAVPAEYRQLAADAHSQFLKLMTLPPTDILTLVCQRLGVTTLPEPVANFIQARAEGHPFFSEELAYALRDAGLIEIAAGQCRLAAGVNDLRGLEFPDTLQGVITSRIDRLTPQQQLTLKVASVIGRVFTFPLLQEVHPIETDKPVLTMYLETLERLDLTPLESPSPELAYIFKHIITQEVAYNLMSFDQRRQLHQAVAEWYERTYQGELPPFYPLLAHHWRKVAAGQQANSSLVLKAVDYLHKAGEQAVQRSANVEAISHLTMALDLLQTLPDTPGRTRQEFTLQFTLSSPLIAIKGYGAPETVRAFDHARQLAAQIGDTSQLFPLLYGKWITHLIKSEHQVAREMAEQFFALAQQQLETGPMMMAHRLLGFTFVFMGKLQTGHNHLEQASTLFDPQQHQALTFRFGQHPQAAIHSLLAWSLWLLGYPDQALQPSQEAINTARELKHINTLAYVLFHGRSLVHQYRQDVERVAEDTQAMIEIAEREGLVLWLAYATVIKGWIKTKQGQPEAGVSEMLKGLTNLQATGTKLYLVYLWALLVEGYAALGQYQEGLNIITEALAFVEETDERYWEAELYRLKGELLLQTEAKAEAEMWFWKAIEVARQQSAKSLELRATVSLARLWQEQGKTAKARQILAEIYGWFTEGFDTADLREAKSLLEGLG
ncbi:MAG: AAA family ATPase [Chloroflexi bacterium]|nr:AAA family ATPase [Chloroflexota bacterium]